MIETVSHATKTEHRFLSVPLSARLDDQLDTACADLGLSRAAIARLALRAFLLSNPKHVAEATR